MDLQTLIRPLLAHDFGAWSRADIDSCLQGGTWEQREGSGRGSLAVARGDWTWAAYPRQDWDEDFWGEFTSVSVYRYVTQEEGNAAYQPLLAAAVAELGPPALVGGPGAFARWRGPDVTINVCVDRRFHRDQCRVELSIVPTEAAEWAEHRRAKWDPDYEPEDRWEIRPDPSAPVDRTLLGRMSYWLRLADDWPTLRTDLRVLFGSLAGDLPVLHPYASGLVWVLTHVDDPNGWLAQGWFAPDECHLEIRHDETVATLPPTHENGRHLAERTVDALEAVAQSPEQIRQHYFANVKPQEAFITGFGLAHVSRR